MIIELKNYVPESSLIGGCGWEFSYSDGEFFEAVCSSRDGKVVCKYRLDTRVEELDIHKTVKGYNNEYQVLVEQKRVPISQNDGTGKLVLSTNKEIEKRFGHFRRKKFQDFMDEFNITNIKRVSHFGYDTTHLIQNFEYSKGIVYLPEGSCIKSVVGSGTKFFSYNKPARIIPEQNSFSVVRVAHAPYWVYHQEKDGKVNRTLFIYDKSIKNVMDLKDELTKLL